MKWCIIFLGYDVWDNEKDLGNMEIFIRVWRIFFVFDVKYFSNVIVYGFFGIYYIEFLDGFKMDNSKLFVGVIYDGIGRK